MRFLFEFVSCCGSPTQRAPEPAVPPAEEERWLVPATTAAAPSRRPCRKKQRMGAAEWRPSLGPISEDAAPPRERESPRISAASSAARDAKKRSAGGAGGAAKVRYRSYSDGYSGSVAMPTIMPTFSPTPFMF
ncbi:hypothetical protein E2542_SST09542 [Spatholobus suberectus]|nr:hypothetical protein E2542_SST30591 [Spatholobus suberectus]TKY66662.1 hypothetical protein E2542_SST09542 [Spatholobus suberectus]